MNLRRLEPVDTIYPLAFTNSQPSPQDSTAAYLRDPAARLLLDFFTAKGLARLKEEDRREEWYDDWLAYQAEHGLYAAMLSPQQYSARGATFDLLRYARFLELFAWCSPAHGYSLQVTFLGLFSILGGTNEALRQEAVKSLEAGGLLAFAVSEKAHGSDLLANEFVMTETDDGSLIANGTKYYIGNANAASLIAILGRKTRAAGSERPGRDPFLLMALRPGAAPGFRDVTKIHTLGVRAAYVGAFAVKDHALPESDTIAEGRDAWDAVFRTVTLGKFFLGFGSIGICEHAFHEARTHLSTRILYGKPVIEMPHIRLAMAEAFARLTAMKLFAYRALDYVHGASHDDRRYLLFCAVQKAKVSTEAVKVLAILSECIGARGFEGDTFFEMALRDVQLIPGLEGSVHINLRLASQFLPRYFDRPDRTLTSPPSLVSDPTVSHENPYLYEARSGSPRSIPFRPFLDAYHALAAIPNVTLFARQAAAFRRFTRSISALELSEIDVPLGHSLATIAYAQLIAEHATTLSLPPEITSLIFGLLVIDLSSSALRLAAIPQFEHVNRALITAMIKAPRTRPADWAFIPLQ
ncbi:MAG TPA: acyl-CoA dehydrogenase family protein [Phycisphaerae bacterium]|nr:acyl-CoA dehydrogenase family protein [Phycisphaerae bacterium]